MLQVLNAAREAGVRVFYALHHRYRPGDYERPYLSVPVAVLSVARRLRFFLPLSLLLSVEAIAAPLEYLTDLKSPDATQVLTSALAFSPDGRFLIASQTESPGHNRLTVWRIDTWTEVQSLGLPSAQTVWGLGFSPDGRQLAAVGPFTITLFRYREGDSVETAANKM